MHCMSLVVIEPAPDFSGIFWGSNLFRDINLLGQYHIYSYIGSQKGFCLKIISGMNSGATISAVPMVLF